MRGNFLFFLSYNELKTLLLTKLPKKKFTCQNNNNKQAKTVIAPLDRIKILFQARNPVFDKYAGKLKDKKNKKEK